MRDHCTHPEHFQTGKPEGRNAPTALRLMEAGARKEK
jgi:hypothetical protein